MKGFAPWKRTWWDADRAVGAVGWLGVLAFAIYVVVPGLLPGKSFDAVDRLTTFNPWSLTAESAEITNVGNGDTIDSVIPSSTLITGTAREGAMAQWNPYESGGTSAGALPNYALLSPLSLPWWVLPAEYGPGAVKLMEIGAVALGFQLLLRRRWRLPSVTAPVATLIYITSGFMLAWTNWPQTRVAALIPLLFWSVELLATQARWRNMVPFGVVVASMLLGGFPAVTAYAGLSVVAYWMVRSLAQWRGMRDTLLSFVQAVGGGVLAIGLSAINILPFAWFSTHYVDLESRSNYKGLVFDPRNLGSTLVPDVLGLPNNEWNTWPVHFVEGITYLGAAALVLIAVACLIRPALPAPRGVFGFFFVSLLFVGYGVYFGGIPNDLMNFLPTVGSSLIGRVRSVLGMYAAVLAALGLAAVWKPEPWRIQLARVRGAGASAVWFAARVTGIAALTVVLAYQTNQARLVDVTELPEMTFKNDAVKRGLLLLAVVFIVVLLATLVTRVAWKTALVAMVVALTAVPNAALAHQWWPISSASNFYPTTDVHEYLKQNLGGSRYATVEGAMMPGSSSYYRQRALTGHTFTTPQWHSLLEFAVPGIFKTSTYSTISRVQLSEALGSAILDRLAVKYIVADANTQVLENDAATGAEVGSVTATADGTPFTSGTGFGPVNGVTLRVLGQSDLPTLHATMVIRLVGNDGAVLAESQRTIKGIAGDEYVMLKGQDIPDGTPWHVEVTLSGSAATVTYSTDASGQIVVEYAHASNVDQIGVIGATVLRRDSALERIRWAGDERVIADEAQRLAAMNDSATGASTVILEHEDDARGVSGATGSVSYRDVDENTVEATVTSEGAGWVVIADPMRSNGWSATLDGEPAQLVDAEEALVAVYVGSAGTHHLRLHFQTPMYAEGKAVTAGTGGMLALWAAGAWALRRRKVNANG